TVAAPGARALPDGEVQAGTPIPAIVPLPTLAMAPIPGYVQIQNGRMVDGGTCQNNQINGIPVQGGCSNGQKLNGQVVVVSSAGKFQSQFKTTSGLANPGYPFFISGIAGHRPPHPPFDIACQTPKPGAGCTTYLDGGLPRHVITSPQNPTSVPYEQHNIWDFTKENVNFSRGTPTDALRAVQVPENGTPVEQVAMRFMGVRQHPSFTPGGVAATFIANGLPCKPPQCLTAQNAFGSQQGAPFADPAVGDQSERLGNNIRTYKAADIQMDVVFNKKSWHSPQQRFITLWQDVEPTMQGQRAPEPFFFRADSKQDVINFWLTNLVPANYDLDDFQVRTPTDIIGQHIHLVKFDVLASDGAANGFNYEDGSWSPEEVQDRIAAIKNVGGSWDTTTYCTTPGATCPPLRTPQSPPSEICGAPGRPACPAAWAGAQTTVQRWYPDELTGCFWPPCTTPSSQNDDRTLRTVFTHDHFSPSTHQQVGLYAGLVVEPQGSSWTLPNGTPLGTRDDGGPTSWNANIIAGVNGANSFREFALEFADTALAYTGNSVAAEKPYPSPANYPSSTPISPN